MNTSVRTQDISLTRGDSHIITFTIIGENGEPYIIDSQDRLYFTVKKSPYKSDCIIQKTYGNGIKYNADTQEYEIEFTSECTCSLEFCRFVYDIELMVIREGKEIVKTLVQGNLTIGEEVTHKENEV